MTDIDPAKELELLGSGDGADLPTTEVDENILGEATDAGSMDTNGTSKTGTKVEDVDLYDDAIAPSGQTQIQPIKQQQETKPYTNLNSSSSSMTGSLTGYGDRKYCCYVGNMTWWTTDADLQLQINSIGVQDIIEMKFFENRLTGQSKGYALCMFGSDQAVRMVTEKLPHRPIHGSTLCVLPYTKQSLSRLEEAVAKTQTRPDPKVPKKDDGCLNMGTIRIGAGGVSTQGSMMSARPAAGLPLQMNIGGQPGGMMMRPPNMSQPAPMQMGQMNRPPGAPLPLMINGQPSMQQAPPMMRPHQMTGPPGVGGPPGMGAPPVQLHLNLPPGAPRPVMSAPQPMMSTSQPQPLMHMQTSGPVPTMQHMHQRPPGMPFGQQPPGMAPQPLMNQQLRPPGAPGMPPMNAPPSQMPPGAHVNPQMFPGMQPPGGAIPDAEFEEIMNRNRTVSSSAISRAVSDAASGDVKAAVETLLTAISLIKQSRVSHDDRCRMLVASLQDTLNGIESKSYGSSSSSSRSKHRDRDRSRSRSRDRDRKRRRHSRSSSRSRSPPRHRSSRRY